jgi:hypothetical protein
MILPVGRAVHENLGTAYTNLDQLLNELRANQFTGYVDFRSWKYQGVIFMDSGNLLNVIEEDDSARRTGVGAMEGVQKHAKEKDGVVSVYQLDGDLVGLLAGSVQRSALFERLSTDLTHLDRLMDSLQKEKQTGHVEISLSNKSVGMIFLQGGRPLAAFHTNKGASIFGAESIAKMIEYARDGATFNVYHSDPTLSLGQDFVSLELIATWQNLLGLVEKSVDDATARGTFSMEFKRGCLENVNTFPFLDPFADGFEFRDGRIRFEGGVSHAQFTAGLIAAFRAAASKLSGPGLRAYQTSVRMAIQNQHTQLATWGILDALGEISSG